ncbi:MAG: hypothetical protein Dbin4_02831 [Alphaproteobacteria bacterium]|nr:hypothetical protein [Alphaproteobacteria bacterium]
MPAGGVRGKGDYATMIKNLKIPSDPIEAYECFRGQVQGTNINPKTLLATDYLNHFNEIIMLVEILPDMMECVEDVAGWAPKTYVEHFRESSFSHRDLAVAAYEYAPPCFRQPLEKIIDQLNGLILILTAGLLEAAARKDAAEIARAATVTPELRRLVEMAGGIINGETHGTDQADIDALLKKLNQPN